MLIAERMLHYRTASGVLDIPVRLYAPENEYKCKHIIVWPDGAYTGYGWGIDQVQALDLSMRAVSIRLYFSDYHRSGNLYWREDGPGYGFPMLKAGRDLLAGYDKEFDG